MASRHSEDDLVAQRQGSAGDSVSAFVVGYLYVPQLLASLRVQRNEMSVQGAQEHGVAEYCHSAVVDGSVPDWSGERIRVSPKLFASARVQRPDVARRQSYKHGMSDYQRRALGPPAEVGKLKQPLEPQPRNMRPSNRRETAGALGVLCV